MTIQRGLKAIGTFSYQTAVCDRGSAYEAFIQPTLCIVLQAADWLERFPALRRMLRQRINGRLSSFADLSEFSVHCRKNWDQTSKPVLQRYELNTGYEHIRWLLNHNHWKQQLRRALSLINSRNMSDRKSRSRAGSTTCVRAARFSFRNCATEPASCSAWLSEEPLTPEVWEALKGSGPGVGADDSRNSACR